MSWLFEQVQNQMRTAYASLQDKYDASLFEQLLEPKNIVEATVEITKDDWSVVSYPGWRSQHTNVKWPYKGGIRFHQNVSLDEVKSLSAWMSFKTAVVNLPLGWWKGGIIVNPKELSMNELEQLSRGFMRKIADHVGPLQDVPAPDVNTNGTIMGWMVDEYSKIKGVWTPGVITGKPLPIGGSKGRMKATSLGGLMTLERYFEHTNDSIKGKKIVVQGAWNVGMWFADLAAQAGAIIIAISDSRGAIVNTNGLDVKQIIELKSSRKSVTEYTDAEKITNEQLLELECDVLVPAALENVITEENAADIKAPLVLELANGPTAATGDKILTERGIKVLPDILANAGWVTVSYFEQVQNNTNYYWEEEEVNDKLGKIMRNATDGVYETANAHSVTYREAAYIVALGRLLEAMKLRGW